MYVSHLGGVMPSVILEAMASLDCEPRPSMTFAKDFRLGFHPVVCS